MTPRRGDGRLPRRLAVARAILSGLVLRIERLADRVDVARARVQMRIERHYLGGGS